MQWDDCLMGEPIENTPITTLGDLYMLKKPPWLRNCSTFPRFPISPLLATLLAFTGRLLHLPLVMSSSGQSYSERYTSLFFFIGSMGNNNRHYSFSSSATTSSRRTTPSKPVCRCKSAQPTAMRPLPSVCMRRPRPNAMQSCTR